jgi:hypothetical protein
LLNARAVKGGGSVEMETTRINGFKLSKELILIRLQCFSNLSSDGLFFLEKLNDHKINIVFLSWIVLNGKIQLSCCITLEDRYQVQAILASRPGLEKQSSIDSSIGLLSLFPHKNSLGFLAQSLKTFVKMNLPIYGLSSSLSSITVVTDYRSLQDTKYILKESLNPG